MVGYLKASRSKKHGCREQAMKDTLVIFLLTPLHLHCLSFQHPMCLGKATSCDAQVTQFCTLAWWYSAKCHVTESNLTGPIPFLHWQNSNCSHKLHCSKDYSSDLLHFLLGLNKTTFLLSGILIYFPTSKRHSWNNTFHQLIVKGKPLTCISLSPWVLVQGTR